MTTTTDGKDKNMTPEQRAELRKPFKKEQVGLLPKVTCKACSDRKCQQHRPAKCAQCGNYLTTAHIHIDYVGHAAVTDRLLAVDPSWSWEPMALDQMGLPALDRDGNLWIKLTVCGQTRLGCGDGPSMKVRIGDAIRNAAMRFGVALDLWSKEELEGATEPVFKPTEQAEAATQVAEADDLAVLRRAVADLYHTPEQREQIAQWWAGKHDGEDIMQSTNVEALRHLVKSAIRKREMAGKDYVDEAVR